jgi:ferric-dicitrate binding protein FerR (iron transport regulator)
MNRDDIQKLLGGYATGTLTPEEQQALFEAALTDQELFDALAREQALRDVLSDPTARAHLLAAIDDVPAPWYRQWWRPMVVMAAAVLAVAGVAIWEHSREPKPLTVWNCRVSVRPPPPGAPRRFCPHRPK